jgi:uncharacterized protein (UPF0332 family)
MKEIPEYATKELDRSKESLLGAKILLENNLFADSVSRSYYAVLHSAKAALHINVVESKTHEGVRRMFGLHLVKTGKIEKEFSDILTIEQEDRIISDYEVDIEIDDETAKQRFDEAVRFVERIEEYFREFTANK